MIVRTVDSNNDWNFGAGLSNYASGNAAVIQLIGMRLLSFLGDCFFDLGAGIPWISYLSTPNTQLQLNLAVAAAILNTPDQNGNSIVTGINQLSVALNRQTRNLSVQYQAVTTYSTVAGTFQYDLGGVS